MPSKSSEIKTNENNESVTLKHFFENQQLKMRMETLFIVKSSNGLWRTCCMNKDLCYKVGPWSNGCKRGI